MRVTQAGRALRGAGDRAPWTLHLMSLLRTETEAVITVVIRMHWPPDGSSTDLELTQGRPAHHMPYDQLWAVDDQGTRYQVRLEGGRGGTATWLGHARLSPVPPYDARRLDLIGDGTRLIQLPLGPPVPPGPQSAPPATERVALQPGERLLVLEAEHILATGDATGGARGQVRGPSPGEIITVLMETGAIAAGSPVPGQLAALCQRLGAAGHGITVPPGEELPAPWASVIAHRDAPVPPGAPEVFAPLSCVLPDVDGARFALAGLSTATGRESPARDQQRHAAARGPVRVELDARLLLVAQGQRRELARRVARRAGHLRGRHVPVHVRGRHAGLLAAPDPAAHHGPSRARGDRPVDPGPRHGGRPRLIRRR